MHSLVGSRGSYGNVESAESSRSVDAEDQLLGPVSSFARSPATSAKCRNARFTLKVYTQATKRRERLSAAHRRAYDRAIEWAQMGTNNELERVLATAEATKNPA
jgi:hypothetical protein